MAGSWRQGCAVALFALPVFLGAPNAGAAVLRIADGDCAALSSAAATAGEGSLIVLATRGTYGGCSVVVTGHVTIDGAGASMTLLPVDAAGSDTAQIDVRRYGELELRNLNLHGPASSGGSSAAPVSFLPSIINAGTLLMNAVTLSNIRYASGSSSTGSDYYAEMILNSGPLSLRNVTLVGNAGSGTLIRNQTIGSVDMQQSTLVVPSGSIATFGAESAGGYEFDNDLLVGDVRCLGNFRWNSFRSGGGNVATADTGCLTYVERDSIVADAEVGTFGDNGGLVDTVKLTDRSPAIGNGLAANCEAADARGVVRNVAARGACDSGAYEYGGGRGLLSEGGMNGFFYDAAADDHYVTVQRLDWGSALVIWNTFDRNGNGAWIYAIGMVDGKHIHAEAAQNVGGRLQPGGAPAGGHGIVWGTIDVDFANCFDATFRYDSALPNFGAGQFALDRLAFLGDLDCSD